MEIVAETVLSVSLEALFKQLGSADLLKFARQEQLLTHLKKWEKKLLEIHEVLDDAEEKQIKKQSVKAWLGDLRDLAYDMEDLLDEFSYEALRRNTIAKESTSKVRKFIPTCITFTPVSCMRNVKMASKIKGITTRLEAVYAQKAELGLDKVASISQFANWERPLTTCLVYEPEIYGRNADKQIIINMLRRDEHKLADQTNVSVVPIVGMGGMGKTTLARLVYDDPETAEHFNLKAWVCVSDQFDAVRVTKTILSSVMTSHSSTDSLDFNQIQEKLREELKGKKFLLVLDDMWNENYADWYCLQSPFLSGSRGSKIIVTTRNRRVAIMMGGEKNLHELERLSNDECWLVFKKHAFGNSNIDEQSTLGMIGKEIVKKCGGLPLAARALGGLLRNEQRQERWNAILTSKIWELTESNIIPALRLSYNHLSPYLKKCFAYCAIFPKDYEFKKEELILLWVAEGFVQQSNDHEENEDLGEEYFLELLSKSFFQLSTSNASRFVMHDLVHDLAKSVSKGICMHSDGKLENDLQDPISNRMARDILHISYIRHSYNTFQMFEGLRKNSHLRTVINLSMDKLCRYGYISNKVLQELIPRLRHLRVLSLSCYNITEIPDSFGTLKHLRYLDLSETDIRCLPDSIGNLYHLQTLKLSGCRELSKLPNSIGNLINLRHLDVSGENKLQEMPSQIGSLKELRLLSNFVVGDEDNGLNIKELSSMRNLGGELCISKLKNMVNAEDARAAGMKLKHKLKSLMIAWNDGWDDESGKKEGNEMDMEVLHSLQPHSNLEKLKIEAYGGLAFPRWVSDASLLSKMVDLSLVNCKNCTSLPCLGQLPSLKHLMIIGMHRVKKVGAEFYFYGETRGSADKFFPSLESLEFRDMREWEHWEDWSSSSSTESLFPCLNRLFIVSCQKLIKNLPTYLPYLTMLSISYCPKLEFPFIRLPSLKELAVWRCNGTVLRSGIALTSLTHLKIFEISGLAKLHEGFVQNLLGLQTLGIGQNEELTCLWDDDELELENLSSRKIRHCRQLVSLGCNLRFLRIDQCYKLERLPNGWQSLTCLEELKIQLCPKLVSFPEVGFPPNLRHLTLQDCEGLKCLPDGMMLKSSNDRYNSCLLESLNIRICSSLICFPKGQLPFTLKRLNVKNCESLSSLPEGIMMHLHCNSTPMGISSLEELFIEECPSLTDFPEGSLPTTLEQLTIASCENLKSLPEGIMHHHSSNTTTSSALRVLQIYHCPSLTSFPRGKFPSTLKKLIISEPISEEMFHSSPNNSLQYLSISTCPNLKALPDCLSDLSDLSIAFCENLELRSHQFQNFTRLTSLRIYHRKSINIPLSQWGLTRLTSLTDLSIEAMFPDATSFSFPDDHHHRRHCSGLLPTTLTSLTLGEFQNLKSLASLSLETLTSLTVLGISNCPKLRSILPRNKRLPATLSSLWIQSCPLLRQRYSKEEGKDWPKIAHIPYVFFGFDSPH